MYDNDTVYYSSVSAKDGKRKMMGNGQEKSFSRGE